MVRPSLPLLVARQETTAPVFTGPLHRLVTLDATTLMAIDIVHGEECAFSEHLGPLPSPGQSTRHGTLGDLLWSSRSQVLLFSEDGTPSETALSELFSGVAYVTDLSDGWAALELSGEGAQAAIDQITMPNLSDASFPVGSVTSTSCNHVRVIIWRRNDMGFLLLSATSSIRSLQGHLRHELTHISNA